MLRCVKTATQIIAGYWVTLAILAALGVAGYAMIDRFESDATTLVDRELAEARHLTAVTRAAREACSKENSPLPVDKEAIQSKSRKLAELEGHLDRLDSVAARFDDTEMTETVEQLRALAAQCGEAYDDGAIALERIQAAEQTLDEKGGLLDQQSAAGMTAQRSRYTAAKGALAVGDRIHALAMEIRMKESEYLLSKERDSLGAIQKHIAGLLTGYGELERSNPDAVEQKQIEDARKVVWEHLGRIQALAAKWKQTARDSEVLGAQGSLAVELATAHMDAKKVESTETRNALAIVGRIHTLALQTRLAEKGRALSQEQKYRTYVSIVRQLQGVSKDLDLLGGSPFKIGGDLKANRNAKSAEPPPLPAIAPEIRCVMSEQNYLDAIQKNIADLQKCSDELGKQGLRAAQPGPIADVRKTANDYVDAVNKWMSEYKKDVAGSQLDDLVKAIDRCGDGVVKAAADYVKANEVKVQVASDAAFIAADIVNGLRTARMHEKSCLSARDDEYCTELNDLAARLPALCDGLRKVSQSPEDQQQVGRISAAVKQYAAGARSWVKNLKDSQILAKTAEADARAIGDAATAYRAAKQAEVSQLAETVLTMAEAAKEASLARLNEKGYRETREEKYGMALYGHVARLSQLYEALKVSPPAHEGSRSIERAAKAAKDYLVAAKAWLETDKAIRAQILTGVETNGRALLDMAQTAEHAAWEASDEEAASLRGIVMAAKTGLILSLTIGMVVIVLLGTLIAEKASRSINALIGETSRLSQAVANGALRVRGNPELVPAEFQPILHRVNRMLDTVAGPLNTAADCMERISLGRIPAKITDKYQGDFRRITDNLNRCIDELTGLSCETRRMSHMHNAGDTERVIPLGHLHGAYREMAKDFNATVAAHIAVNQSAMACIAELGKGNFDAPLEKFPEKWAFINGSIENVRANLKNIANEATTLAKAAATGQLSIRASEQKYAGAWRRIIQSMNATLEGCEAPIRDIGEVLRRIANKDFSLCVKNGYPGTYGQLCDNVNLVAATVRATVERLNHSAVQFAEGCRVIAESSETLGSGARAQTSSAEEMMASMEELARWVQMVKKNAEQANQVAREANQLAAAGALAVRQSIDSTRRIRSRSQQMSDIIQVISNTVSRTNLLGFNAAIETARRGEQGSQGNDTSGDSLPTNRAA